MPRTWSREVISTKQEAIAELARRTPKRVLTTLAHRMDLDWLLEAHRRIRKDGAAGVDGTTARAYEKDLVENLEDLLDRVKSGLYHAPAVRRVHIPKGEQGKTRPIGIPTYEDKVLQRAILMLLEPVYEQDFLDCSYGFRPGRSAHDGVEELWQGLRRFGGGWLIDLDIHSFFEDVVRSHLYGFLDQRVRDGVVRRAIGKWMNAGVMEDGLVSHPATGTPQGGVISPLLSNIYLHEVLDQWFEQEVQHRLSGRSFMVRYADDAVLVFELEEDARRVLEVLRKRFEKYGLTLNAKKTRLVDFRRPRDPRGKGQGSFDFLGFTHYWGLSRRGNWTVKRKTMEARFTRAVKAIKHQCRFHRHDRVKDQRIALNRMLQGHYNYYGVTGNFDSLKRFYREVERLWQKWLGRRSRSTDKTWERFKRLLSHHPLVKPHVARHLRAT